MDTPDVYNNIAQIAAFFLLMSAPHQYTYSTTMTDFENICSTLSYVIVSHCLYRLSCAYPRRLRAGYTLDGASTHRRARTHTLNYTLFRDSSKFSNQPRSMSLWEETGAPGENPPSHSTHTVSGTRTRDSNPGLEPCSLEV